VPDSSFLQWPFFDQTHRDFAQRLADWVAALPPSNADEDSAAACRHWVRELGTAGLLDACLQLDVRTLCLAREALAYRDALADFAFAMQGLGSGPISLFGSAEQKSEFLPKVAAGESIAAFALS
jgi:acyl-CoA dehydrogenase